MKSLFSEGEASGAYHVRAVSRRARAEHVIDRLPQALRDQSQREPEPGSELNSAGPAALSDRVANLTARERQVLDGLVAGQPNKTIARNLGISPRTVEIYRANVMTKMQAANLSELVRFAIQAGLS